MGNEVKQLALTDVKLSGFNPRKHFDEGKMKELAVSVKEKGVIEPLIVRAVDGKYELVCGERRLKASKQAGIKTVPAIVKELTDIQAMEFQVIENLQREDLDPMDEAAGFKAMIEKCGYTHIQLAEKIGKSRAYISNRMRLLTLSKSIQDAVSRETISPGHAMVILRIEDTKARTDLFNRIIEQKYSIRFAENELADYSRDLKQVPFDRADCKGCMFQGDNQKDLIDKDTKLKSRCLNSACYLKKAQAWIQSRRDQIKKKGFKVFTEKEMEAKGFKRYGNNMKELDKNGWAREQLGAKYQKKCCAASCVGRIFVIMSGSYGNEEMQTIEEWCTDPQCYAKLTRSRVSAGESTKTKSERHNADMVKETKRRIWVKEIGGRITDEMASVMILYHLFKDGIQWGDVLADLGLGKKGEGYWEVHEKLLARILKMNKAKRLSAIRKFIVDLDASGHNDSDLDCIAGHLGFDIRKDFFIDEPYLKTRTKNQLVALAKEIGLSKKIDIHVGTKATKSELINCFMKKGFDLKGKVPKEIAKKTKEE